MAERERQQQLEQQLEQQRIEHEQQKLVMEQRERQQQLKQHHEHERQKLLLQEHLQHQQVQHQQQHSLEMKVNYFGTLLQRHLKFLMEPLLVVSLFLSLLREP